MGVLLVRPLRNETFKFSVKTSSVLEQQSFRRSARDEINRHDTDTANPSHSASWTHGGSLEQPLKNIRTARLGGALAGTAGCWLGALILDLSQRQPKASFLEESLEKASFDILKIRPT